MSSFVSVVIGALSGWLVGLVAWLASRHFVDQGGPGSAHDVPVQRRSVPSMVQGAIRLPAVLTQAGMLLWGAYVGWQAPDLERSVSALVVTALLVAICLVDFQVRRIPNALVLALLAWACVQILWIGQPPPVVAGMGLLAAGGLFLVLAILGRGALGMGDVKLAAALGAVLGFPLILSGLLLGVIAGGLVALLLLATRRLGRKDPMAYGPYLALGAWIVWIGSLGLWP